MKQKDRYERVVYGMAQFHVDEGFYTIAQLEEMLASVKEIKAAQDRRLDYAMREAGNV